MGITGEKRERQVKGRHDKVKVVSKIKHVNSNGVLHGPITEGGICLQRFDSFAVGTPERGD